MGALTLGLLGLIIGSFLNVLVLRHGGKTLGGRSECMSCGKQIAWYDNIPVVSWLLLRGHCRHCGSAISVQYPLVEASTAILFALIGASFPWPPASIYQAGQLFLACAAAGLLIAIAVYDIRHTIIPDAWAYTFACAALLYGFLAGPQLAPLPLLLAGPIAALPLFALWAVSRGRWMGLGDAKLALGIGWLLGLERGLFAVFFAFILGAAVSVPLLVLSSRWWRRFMERFTPTASSPKSMLGFTMGSEIPFGPFLVVSCIIVWLLLINGIDLAAYLAPLP